MLETGKNRRKRGAVVRLASCYSFLLVLAGEITAGLTAGPGGAWSHIYPRTAVTVLAAPLPVQKGKLETEGDAKQAWELFLHRTEQAGHL